VTRGKLLGSWKHGQLRFCARDSHYHAWNLGLGLAGLLLIATAWCSFTNTNFLYLIYLFCSYLAAQLLIQRRHLKLVAFVLLLFFVLYSPFPAPRLPDQLEVLAAGISNIGTPVPPGTTRHYRFIMSGLAERRRECGAFQHGDIYVQGANLVPTLRTDHGELSYQEVDPHYSTQRLHARIKLDSDPLNELRVSLTNPQEIPLTIFRGPEISGSILFLDGIYMIFNTDRCRVVLHAQRTDQ
jgi:hypothetical protein